MWIPHEVTIEFQERNASGRYSISRGTITVSTVFYGRKSTHVGGVSMSAAQPMSASHPKATELPRGNEMTLRANRRPHAKPLGTAR